MHVAFVVSSFPAVSHTFIDNQIRGLQAAGHRVSVHAFGKPATGPTHAYWSEGAGAPEVHYGKSAPRVAWRRLAKAVLLAPEFARAPAVFSRGLLAAPHHPYAGRLEPLFWAAPLQSAADADAWICHFGDVGLRALAARRLQRRPGRLLVFFHGADITRFVQARGRDVYRQLFAEADLCLPISERWKARLLELGADPARVKLHRMGVDVSRFAYLPRQLPPSGPVRLLSVGRLVEKKGIDDAIRAIGLLPEALRARIDYRVAGDGPLMEHLRNLIRTEGLQDRVQLLGWRDQAEVVELVQSAHLMLVPSITARDGDQEGIPVSAMEAMATGLPVIATRHSGIPELVRDHVNGRLADERDPSGLAAAITATLDDPERYADYGREARALVESSFDERQLNIALERLLVTVCG